MKRYLIKQYLKIKSFWIINSDDFEYNKDLRRKLVKEMANELLEEPLTERLIMLKKLNDIIMIQSFKEQKEYEEYVNIRSQALNNFKL